MDKKLLTDNPLVSVYHWRKFLPKNYIPNQDWISETGTDTYEKSVYFYKEKEKRIAQINIHKNIFYVSLYYADPFPHGYWYNIDWNDTTYLELTKNAGKIGLLEICKILYEKGYEYGYIS